jgi:hypothetical protein
MAMLATTSVGLLVIGVVVHARSEAAPTVPVSPGHFAGRARTAPTGTLSAEQVGARLHVDKALAATIAADLRLRETMGFRTDLDLVAALRLKPDTADPALPEFPMTRTEYKEFTIRREVGLDGTKIRAALTKQPLGRQFGGLWIDQRAGGLLVVSMTRDGVAAAEHLLAGDLRHRLLHPDRVRVRSAPVTEEKLEAAADRASRYLDQHTTIASDGTSVGYHVSSDVPHHEVDIGLPPGVSRVVRRAVEKLLDDMGVGFRVTTTRSPRKQRVTVGHPIDERLGSVDRG